MGAWVGLGSLRHGDRSLQMPELDSEIRFEGLTPR